MTRSAPTVTVVIPVYNAARHLQATVDSVLSQTFTDFELILVDDGSTDDSLGIAQPIAAGEPERITLLQHEGGANRGVAATRNLAARHAHGRYLAFLDADDQWLPDKLEQQTAWMEAHPEVGLTFTQARILREGGGEDFIPGVDILGDEPPEDPKLALVAIIQVSVNYIFSTVMVRTDAFREAGCFTEDLPFQSEDRILVARVSAEHPVALVPEVLCEYLAHDDSYSAGVVREGLAPVVFFDMQTRVVDWLARENGKKDWARDISGSIMPVYFVAALLCKRDWALMKHVLGNLRTVLRLFPDILPLFLWVSFLHTRVGLFFRKLINPGAFVDHSKRETANERE